MSSAPTLAPVSKRSASEPIVLFVQGDERRALSLDHTPFTVGRRPEKDVVIADPRVSRDHAEIILEAGQYLVVDNGSKHGTFINGERVQRRQLMRGDKLEFGVRQGAHLLFDPLPETNPAREFLSQISVMAVPGATSDLEKLTLFLEAARTLNTRGAVNEILVSLLESTLRLTRAERGFVFLRNDDGTLRLAVGRSAKGKALVDDATISHSILEEAALSASDFMLTDTLKSSEITNRQSIIANDLRTVICIPLRSRAQNLAEGNNGGSAKVLGVLYLDSRLVSGDMSGVSHEILSAIATEAAALVENASLVEAQEAARRYQQELSIAAGIQQQLMAVDVPNVPFASLQARNLPCRDIGGDFFDVVHDQEGLTFVITDVSGKGMPAALLASILQGMVYAQIIARVPLTEIVASANRFLCAKVRGEKYATMFLARLYPDGKLEYVNCGHVQPVLVSGGKVVRLTHGNVPVGMLPNITYQTAHARMQPGDRFVVVTDGVTEAEDAQGEFFGEERLESASAFETPFENIFKEVHAFRGEVPLNDDCTVLELTYKA